MTRFLAGLVLTLALAACVPAPSAAPPVASSAAVAASVRSATAELRDAAGAVVGNAVLTQTAAGPVAVRVVLTALPGGPGERAVHLHAVGACRPTFAAAGPHANPDGHRHGFLGEEGGHAGDLPNLRVDERGRATLEVRTARVTLADGPRSLFDADGTSIVVHAAPDDYLTDPSGASGDRVACGVLVRSP